MICNRHTHQAIVAFLIGLVYCCWVSAEIPKIVTVDVLRCGVVGDGTTLNTLPLQAAIDLLSRQGGGVIRFPAGRFVVGTIEIKSNVTLELTQGAVLLGSHNASDYRNIDPFAPGDNKATFGYAMITALSATHVGIVGPGLIDGQGAAIKAGQKTYTVRPFLIRWENCTNVVVKDIHLTDPGAWTMQFFQCKEIKAESVQIRSDTSHLANNDGIDIDSCQDVQISDCDIESGDDSICIKATSPVACSDVSVTNCKLKTRCNGIKLGTESLGDFSHIKISHCKLHDIGMSGIALYSVDGAVMSDIKINDLEINSVAVPISIRLGSRLKTFRAGDLPRPVGRVDTVSIENVTAKNAHMLGMLINGIPNHPIETLELKNIDITLDGDGKSVGADVQLAEKVTAYPEYNMFGKAMPVYGAYVRHVSDLNCDRVKLSTTRPDARPPVNQEDVKGISAANFAIGKHP